MDEIGLRLRGVGLVPRLTKGPQPRDRPLSRDARVRAFVDRRELASKLAHPDKVGVVGDATGGVLEGEVAHLALDPGAVDRHGALGRAEDRDHLRDRRVVELDPADLRQDRRIPRRIGQAGLLSPLGAGRPMELSVATVGKRAIAPDASTADALEQAGEQVDSIAVAGSPTPGLAPPDILDPRPQLVGHRRVRSPGGRPALLVQAAMAADPAVVERVAQDVADAIGLKTRLAADLLDADGADRIPLEQRDRAANRRRIDLQRVRRLRQAPEAQRRIAGLVVVAVELRRVAIGHSLGEAEGVPLRRRRLGDELVPVMGIRRQDASVAHDERHADRVEVVLKQFEGPAQVALPAVGVPGKDQVEGARLGLAEHLVHGWRAPHGGAALGDLEHQAGVDEAVTLDEAILLLALAGRAVTIVLAGR